jgi:hypothetical protein
MIELSIICVWFACLSTYLSSANQNIIIKPLNKGLAWAIFLVLLSMSSILINTVYPISVSLLFVLALVMFCWVSIVLIHGHKSLRVLPAFMLILLSVSFAIRVG